MISYEPLLKTLKDKGIPFEELNKKVNGGSLLRSSLNKGKYLPLSVIDAICNALDVNVNEVILHRKGEQPCERKIKISWNKICDRVVKERYSLSLLSRECHLDTSYLSQAKKRNAMLSEKLVALMCEKLNCSMDDITGEE